METDIFNNVRNLSATNNDSGEVILDDPEFDGCIPVEPYDDLRLFLVLCLGTPLALAGLITNLSLTILFSSRTYRATGQTLYFCCLAVLDVLTCVMYALMFSLDCVSVHWHVQWIYHLWHSYTMPIYAASRVASFASVYLIIFATLERFIVVINATALSCMHQLRCRQIIVASIFAVSLVLRVFMPFAILVVLNGCIIVALSRQLKKNDVPRSVSSAAATAAAPTLVITLEPLIDDQSQQCNDQSNHQQNRTDDELICKQQTTVTLGAANGTQETEITVDLLSPSGNPSTILARRATVTVLLVSSYLACSALEFFVKVVEKSDTLASLFLDANGHSTDLYRYLTDLISILVVLNCVLRVVIYCISDPFIRTDLCCITLTPIKLIYNSLKGLHSKCDRLLTVHKSQRIDNLSTITRAGNFNTVTETVENTPKMCARITGSDGGTGVGCKFRQTCSCTVGGCFVVTVIFALVTVFLLIESHTSNRTAPPIERQRSLSAAASKSTVINGPPAKDNPISTSARIVRKNQDYLPMTLQANDCESLL